MIKFTNVTLKSTDHKEDDIWSKSTRIISSFISPTKKDHEILFETDYCFDITLQVQLYDSLDPKQKQIIRNVTVDYTGQEYCGLAAAKAN